LLWVVVGLFIWYVLLRFLPRPFLGGLVLVLIAGVLAFTFFRGSPDTGVLGDIWRVIALPLSPFGIVVILLLIVLSQLLRGTKLNPVGITLLRIAVPTLLLLSLPIVSNFLAQRSETEAIQAIRPAAPQALPPGARRVIVVLAQDTTRLQLRPRQLPPPGNQAASPAPRLPLIEPARPLPESTFNVLANQPIQLTEQGDRLTYATELFNQQRAADPLVIVSASPRPERDRRGGESVESVSEARAAADFLRNRGVTEVIEDSNSITVHDSAENVRQLLQRRNISFGNQIFLVTSAIEMPRAALTFDREFATNGNEGLTVISRPTDFQTLPPADALRSRAQGRDLVERSLRLSDFLPSIDALRLSNRVISEYLTSIYYFLRGWIRPVRNL
jgi:uncharacterized SAM-binding protein YcdF (DUF218 family)